MFTSTEWDSLSLFTPRQCTAIAKAFVAARKCTPSRCTHCADIDFCIIGSTASNVSVHFTSLTPMEPLSPRSGNIQFKTKATSKDMVDEEAKRVEIARKIAKEKEYAPPPPEWVIQPPIAAGLLSEKFKIGKQLGKGGFAICFEGELKNKRKGAPKSVFALKIVRAKMSQKKMEEKVDQMLFERDFQ